MADKLTPASDSEVKEVFDSVIGDIVKEALEKIEKTDETPEYKELMKAETLEEKIKILEKYGDFI